jgi:hypothetical protein
MRKIEAWFKHLYRPGIPTDFLSGGYSVSIIIFFMIARQNIKSLSLFCLKMSLTRHMNQVKTVKFEHLTYKLSGIIYTAINHITHFRLEMPLSYEASVDSNIPKMLLELFAE